MLNRWNLVLYPWGRLKGLGTIKDHFHFSFKKKILVKPICVLVRGLSIESNRKADSHEHKKKGIQWFIRLKIPEVGQTTGILSLDPSFISL